MMRIFVAKSDGTTRVLEVERAASLVRTVALGKTITKVDTTEDTIVYSGITREEFVCIFLNLCARL